MARSSRRAHSSALRREKSTTRFGGVKNVMGSRIYHFGRFECLRSNIVFVCNPTGCILPTKKAGLLLTAKERP